MNIKLNSTDARIKKLHGKYINDTISPAELKELISKSMANRGNVSMNEMASRFRNYRATAPVEATGQNIDNVRGEVL